MATLKLKKPTAPVKSPSHTARAPVRGAGSVPRSRPTLTQAQAERVEREARYQEQLRLRFGDRPPPDFVRRGDPAGLDAPRPRHNPRPDAARRDANAAAPFDSRRPPTQRGGNTAFESRRSAPPADMRRRDEAPPMDRGDRQPRSPVPGPAKPVRQAGPPTCHAPDARRPQPVTPMHRHGRRDVDDDDAMPHHGHAEIPGSMRLSKRMSELGIASRREADEWIAKGWVRVDGRVVSELGSRVVPGQHITVDAKARQQQAQKVTVLLHKPIGYVSGQAEDGYEPAVVLVAAGTQWREDRSGVHFLREHVRGLAPAGRLDIDSTGLLVLTQDGRIAKQLIGEDSDIEKEYLVRVESVESTPLPPDKLDLLRHGLELDGEPLRPAQVEWINEDQLRFVLKEGKKRQIRRMCEAVGLKVIGLKRVRIGDVMLGDLPPGQWRYLRLDERFG